MSKSFDGLRDAFINSISMFYLTFRGEGVSHELLPRHYHLHFPSFGFGVFRGSTARQTTGSLAGYACKMDEFSWKSMVVVVLLVVVRIRTTFVHFLARGRLC